MTLAGVTAEFVVGKRGLEDFVLDLLRPMLRRWPDKNLHSLVRREVRAEIARAVRGAGT